MNVVVFPTLHEINFFIDNDECRNPRFNHNSISNEVNEVNWKKVKYTEYDDSFFVSSNPMITFSLNCSNYDQLYY